MLTGTERTVSEKPLVRLSLIIVNSPYLSDRHLDFVIQALNQQSEQGFNTFWVEQSANVSPLRQRLNEHACFAWELLHPGKDYLEIGGVICWELTSVFHEILEHAQMADYVTYLHKECLPPPDFVSTLLALLPQLEQRYAQKFICALHQLRSPLQVTQLPQQGWLETLQEHGGMVWKSREVYNNTYLKNKPAFWEQAWAEDAFLIPSQLLRDLQLYRAPYCKLYFQDMFNILAWLPEKTYCQDIHWLRLRDSVIYHLQHPREFAEYSRSFLDAIKAHPEVFGHMAYFDMAHSLYGYHEPFHGGQRMEAQQMLNFFYGMVLKSERGTLGLWSVALDAMHQRTDQTLPTLVLRADQRFEAAVSEDLTRALLAWQNSFAKDPERARQQDFEYEGVRLWLSVSLALTQDYQLSYFSLKHQHCFQHLKDYLAL